MSNYKILHATEHGYVVCCKGCLRLHLGFAGNILVFNAEQFFSFAKRVEHYYVACVEQAPEKLESLQIATHPDATTITCTPTEVEHLNKLLRKSSLVLGKERLFQFNYN